MDELNPSFLLRDSSVVRSAAPWCRRLDNLELGILLLGQPWLVGEGARRSDLERQLAALAADLPLGPIYFQRVRRAVQGLEADGALEGRGSGRSRLFVASPKGFAALILNLRVFFDDPTVDGRELELKRALVARWNLVLESLLELSGELVFDEDVERFFAEVEEVTIWGRQVITEELISRALNIQQLIADGRAHVLKLREAALERLERSSRQTRQLQTLDLSLLADDGIPGAGMLLKADPETREVLQSLATRTAPELSTAAILLRYDSFLAYLDDLAVLYGEQLRVADLGLFRARSRSNSHS